MRREAGFTLLEVMIAFVIAALALAALTRGASGGLQSTRVAGHYQEALSRARSRLAEAGAALRPGEQSGDDGGGFAWRLLVRPVATARPRSGPDTARAGRAVLYEVTVTVLWRMDGGARQVTLSTQRLGLAAPEAP